MNKMKRYTDDGPQNKLGKAGEAIVLNHFGEMGRRIKTSVDQYDRKKDLIVEDKLIEVKTQVPFYSKDAFSFKPNQLQKCLSVDELYFVSVPMEEKTHYSCGRVYKVETPKNMKWYHHTTNGGRKMILVPINQESIKEVFTMTDEECKILQKYSISKENNG